MAIAEVEVIEELTFTDLELIHPFDRQRDKDATPIVNRSDGFNHGTLHSTNGLSDHIQEGLVRYRGVGTGKGLTDDLVIISTREDLERNLDISYRLKADLLDIPFGKPVVLEIEDLVDLSQVVPTHMAGFLTIAISNSV